MTDKIEIDLADGMTEEVKSVFMDDVPIRNYTVRGMTEQSPLERAARALVKTYRVKRVPWASDEPKPADYKAARAVLMAIREPSEAMITAGTDYRPVHPEVRSKECWIAMIDAALEG